MRLFIALILFTLSTATFAQSDANQLMQQPTTELETLVPLNDGFVLVMLNDLERPTEMSLRYFNEAEELLAEADITLLRRGLLTQFEGAFEFNGDLVVLTSLYYPGPKRNHLLFRRFSAPDLTEISSEVIDEAYTPEYFRVPFGFAKSHNEEYMAFYSWTYTLPKDPAKLTVRVFNRQMEQVWEELYILPFLNESFYIFDFAVKDNGQALIFCENYAGRPGRYIDEEKIEYRILAAEAGNSNLIEYKLNLPDRIITGLKAKLDTSGAVVGSALMQSTRRKSRHDGLYVFRIPPDGQSIQRKQLALTEEMYEAAYPYGDKESLFTANRHKFANFVVDYIFVEPDGSWIIAAEYRKEDTNSYEIEFNDILVVKVDAGLDRIDWIRRVPKRQTGYQGFWPYLSYKAFHKNDNVFFLYNDSRDNHRQEGPPNSLSEYSGERSRVILMQIRTGSGEMVKNDLTELVRAKNVSAIWPSRVWEFFGKSRVSMYGDVVSSRGGVTSLMVKFAWGDGLY
ncbi:MAG TPA: hypothetical protein VJ953_06340 [Saprospiraceae bacterium]|nr:hypothetical protein [Saprospiraceae bacterium]